MAADTLGDRIAAHRADGWRIELWLTSEGVSVEALRRSSDGRTDGHHLGVMLLCDKGRAAVRGSL